ncbi:MAG: ABC transporter ATP-binding protein [Moraxella sp.]|nr:ABC transporter ATP-binding protein [Moraxella sp.]
MENVTKAYPFGKGKRDVLKNINLTIDKGEKVGILGRNGAGKSTLVRLLGGVEKPTSGKIIKNENISWPIAFGGAFQGSLTGADNVRFVCRIYGTDYDEAMIFVESFAELGKYLYEPVRVYSSGMRARLAFAISMAIDFDCYLIDEVISVGDASFKSKCQAELFEKRSHKSMIIVSHELNIVKKYCDKAAILKAGELTVFDDMEEAFGVYKKL